MVQEPQAYRKPAVRKLVGASLFLFQLCSLPLLLLVGRTYHRANTQSRKAVGSVLTTASQSRVYEGVRVVGLELRI